MITRFDHIRHLLCRRGGKHIAHRAAIQHSLAHIPQKYGKMAAAACCDDPHLALFNRVIGEKDPLITVQQPYLIPICIDNAFHGLFYKIFRSVD